MDCGTDADTGVLSFVADARAFVLFGAHELLVRHVVGAPYGEDVEDDGLLADGSVVESAPVKARLLEAGRVYDLVAVDWLLLQTVCECLEDDEHQLVVLEALHEEADEEVCARVSELAGASGVEGVRCAVDRLLVTSAVSDTERRVAGAVGGEDYDVRGGFGK